jgi:3-phosphoshikimate 1-carboxyvinyltransferase
MRCIIGLISAHHMDLIASPVELSVRATLRVDGDKSISHRAVLFGALAKGITEVRGFLTGEDTRHTAKIFSALGARIDEKSEDHLTVHGLGLHGLEAPNGALDCGNAGTGMRLIAGVLSGQKFASVLVGDESLSARPMRRVLAPLRLMGANIQGTSTDTAPLTIKPVSRLKAIDYTSPVASAQVKSCVLLAGLYAEGTTSVKEPELTRDHSERMLRAFGADVTVEGTTSTIRSGRELHGQRIDVPADPSSAAFFAVAAAICPGSDVLLSDVCINPRRTGIYDTLRDMGADVQFENVRVMGAEPVADIRVRGAALKGVAVPESRVADMIDEFPIFFIAASVANGQSSVTGAAELRVKESDRIGAMVRGLAKLGVQIDERDDGVLIEGQGSRLGHAPVEIDSKGDHRIAMSFVIASLASKVEIKISDCANIRTSFPGFLRLAHTLGLAIRIA